MRSSGRGPFVHVKMRDVSYDPAADIVYECFDCGTVVLAETHPGNCDDCGSPMRNRQTPIE